MTELRRFGLSDFLLLLLVFGAAAALRGTYLLTEADYSRKDPPRWRALRRLGCWAFLLWPLGVGPPGAPGGPYLLAGADYSRKAPPLRVEDASPEPTEGASEMRTLVRNLKEHNSFKTTAPFSTQE